MLTSTLSIKPPWHLYSASPWQGLNEYSFKDIAGAVRTSFRKDYRQVWCDIHKNGPPVGRVVGYRMYTVREGISGIELTIEAEDFVAGYLLQPVIKSPLVVRTGRVVYTIQGWYLDTPEDQDHSMQFGLRRTT